MGKAAARKRAQRAKRQQRQTQSIRVQTNLDFRDLLRNAVDRGDRLVKEHRNSYGRLFAADFYNPQEGIIYRVMSGGIQ